MSAEGFIWLRPDWLWGFLPLLVLLVIYWRRTRQRNQWDRVVDSELRAYVLDDSQQGRNPGPLLLFAGWGLSLLLLAGPVWEQQEVPVFQAEQSEVILFDLSRSMQADDVPPDRLTRARFKLSDLLQRSQGRQTGLIVFTERPYVVSPLTEDAANIAAFIPSLDTDIMPVQGSRLDLAILQAIELLDQAGVNSGHIIAMTDASVTDRDLEAAAQVRASGHRLSVLGVGTPAGSPLRNEQGQFLQTRDGSIVVPRLDWDALQSLAGSGGGKAVRLTTNSDDLDALEGVRSTIALASSGAESSRQASYWIEYAPWGLWVLVPLLLYGFRRGVVA